LLKFVAKTQGLKSIYGERYFMERNLTYYEEAVYRLHSPDFCGLTRKQITETLFVSRRMVDGVLKNLEAKAPQLFPILTVKQNLVKICFMQLGRDRDTTSFVLGLSVKSVDGIIKTLRGKGVCLPRRTKTVPYRDYMDNSVRHRY